MRLTPTTREDLHQIREWINADPFHKNDSTFLAEDLLTPNGLLSFCLCDDKGPLCFIRLNQDIDMVRIVIQFGPEPEVSKRRLIAGLIEGGIPAMKSFAKSKNFKGLVFESVNPSLIAFGVKQGFKSIGHDDYALVFEDKINV